MGLSDEYQVEQLKDECHKFIQTVDAKGICAVKYLALCERFQLDCSISDRFKQELASVPHSFLQSNQAYQETDDQIKNIVLQARVDSLEQTIVDLNPTLATLISQMYYSANERHQEFLTEHALDESVLSRCQNHEAHVDKRIGVKFDLHCQNCRKNVMHAKQFTVKSRDLYEHLEKLYSLSKDIENLMSSSTSNHKNNDAPKLSK